LKKCNKLPIGTGFWTVRKILIERGWGLGKGSFAGLKGARFERGTKINTSRKPVDFP